MKTNPIVMLYDTYLEATRKVIDACTKAKTQKEKAKQNFLLAMLRVMYYEQFNGTYQPHSKSEKFIQSQLDVFWRRVGDARDYADEAGFDWKSCKVPELEAYL